MNYKNYTVMLVDDEQPILNSLKRLIKRLGCNIITFTSPLDALEALKGTSVQLVISDMRMPEMGGEVFLEQVAKSYPDIERVVISGYADAQATIDAVNRGKISRFLLKPWEDEDVFKVVEKGLQLAFLREENLRLQEETEAKNKQLKQLNQGLEAKVKERTQQIIQANDRLKTNYRSVVRMFSALATRRLGVKASGENLKLNKILILVASKTGLKDQDLKQLYYAWQLRQIGKLSLSDELIKEPYLKLGAEQQREFQNHPLLAQAACLMVKPLYPAGKIILQHKEYLDGSGYPKGIKGEEITFRAQVLAVVNDYVELIHGLYDERAYSTAEALTYLSEKAKERYNQDVVALLAKVVEELSKSGDTLNDKAVFSDQLKPGMKLSRDLISGDGMLLLSADQVLDGVAIERIREMEFNLDETFKVYVSQ